MLKSGSSQLPGCELARRCLFAAFTLSFLVIASFAQEIRGTISGTVTDPAGAAVPGTRIEVKGIDTNVVYPATTNEAGFYVVPLIPAGNYAVAASHAGFRHAEESRVEIRVGERAQIDFHLEIGAVSENVEVTAEAPLLETATASRNQVVSDRAVAELPYEGRNTFLSSAVTAGFYFGSTDSLNAIRPFDNGGMDSMQINGGLGFRNNFTINGLPDTAQESANPASLTYVPPPDAVKEVSVESNAYDAQYGHTGGGTINVDLKSGTNQFHGAAYEYVRNTIFNANRWENNAGAVARTPYHWSEPGVEFDGPLWIPHVYDGHNRTFFMFSWERIQDSVPQPLTASVPTLQQIAGDFSATTSGGKPVTIYDPTTTSQTSPGVYTRTAFPGNIVPANRINPVGAKLMSYYPKPNAAGTIDHLNNYFAGGTVVTDLYDVFSYNVDQNINEKNRMSFSYFQANRHQVEPTYDFASPAASPLYLHYRINHGGSVNWTATLSPTTVLDIRDGFERHNFAVILYAMGFDPTQLGYPSSLVSQLPVLTFPQITVGGYSGLGGSRASSSYTLSNTHALQGTLTKIINRHTLKVGSQFNVVLNNYNSPTSMTGAFTFDNTFTQQSPLVANNLQGNGFAALLLGYPTSGNVPNNAAFAYSSHYYGVFVQDDWRLTQRLTVNLGLRWDVETPLTERYNRQNAGFAANATSPLQVPGYNLAGGLLFTSASNRTPFVTDWNNVQPRIGAAYRLDNKTVLRGGFGLYYLPTFDTGFNQGFSVTTTYLASNDGNATPANSLSNPYPNGILRPAGSSLGLSTLLGQPISFADPNRVIPYNEQFSIGVQRQLPNNFLIDASYVGSRTHSLEVAQNFDALSVQNLALGSQLNTTVTNPFAGLLPGSSINGPTITRLQSLLPYPQFASSAGASVSATAAAPAQFGGANFGNSANNTPITEASIPIGHTWYNALQVRIEKRFSNSLFFLLSYTFSKNMQALSFLNAQDGFSAARLERQLTTSDQPQNLRVSGGYELPFFKNRKGLMRALLGGWQINSIVTFASGTPLNAPAGAFSAGVDPNVPSPNHLAYLNTCYLNLSGVRTDCASASQPVAWIQQPTFTLNTLTPVLPNIRIRRPAIADMSVFKTFQIYERLRFQIRAEAFNVTNTVWFPAPNTSLTSPIFGQTTLGTGGFSSTSNDPRAIQLSARLIF